MSGTEIGEERDCGWEESGSEDGSWADDSIDNAIQLLQLLIPRDSPYFGGNNYISLASWDWHNVLFLTFCLVMFGTST